MISGLQLQQWWRTRVMPELSLSEWEYLIPLLRRQQMLARFAWRCNLDAMPIPAYAKRHIQNAVRLVDKQRAQVEMEAAMLHRAIASTRQLVFLKGAAYSLLQHCHASQGRMYSDIDLLVVFSDIKSVEQDLCLQGFIPDEIDPYDDLYYRRWAHEIPPLRHIERGTVLDVHHQLLPPISGRAPDLTPFWQSIRQTPQGHWVLGPAAMYLHSTIHLFCNEEIKHGWRDLTDLALLAEEFDSPEFWQELITLAQTSGFAPELWFSLDQLQRSGMLQLPEAAHTWWQSYQPSLLARTLWRATYTRILSPNRPSWLWTTLLAIRGHWQKMPLPILLKHTAMKGYRAIVSALFGPQFLIKDKDQPHQS